MKNLFISIVISSLALFALACGSTEAEVQVVKEVQEVEVVKEVPVEVVREVAVVEERVKEVEVEKTPKPLVIYSGRSESLVGPIIAQFSEATGTPVEVKYGKTAAMAATLLEEGDKTPADVFFAQDPGGLGAVESMLATLPANITELVPDWADSPDRKWTGISGRARVVVYNTDAISDPATQLPDNIYDFIDPKWMASDQ